MENKENILITIALLSKAMKTTNEIIANSNGEEKTTANHIANNIGAALQSCETFFTGFEGDK